MTKYRKKAAVVDAHQVAFDMPVGEQLPPWVLVAIQTGHLARSMTAESQEKMASLGNPEQFKFGTDHLVEEPGKPFIAVKTPHGWLKALVGDWIVKGTVPDDYYPIAGATFFDLYDEVNQYEKTS